MELHLFGLGMGGNPLGSHHTFLEELQGTCNLQTLMELLVLSASYSLEPADKLLQQLAEQSGLSGLVLLQNRFYMLKQGHTVMLAGSKCRRLYREDQSVSKC